MERGSGYLFGVVYLYLVQGIQYLLPFLVIPIMTTALGASKFGVLMYWTAVMTGLSIVIDFGFGYVGGREAAKKDFSLCSISELYSSIIAARLFVFFFSFCFLCLIVFLSPVEMRFSFVLPLVMLGLIGAVVSPSWLLLASKMTGFIALSSFAGQLLVLGIAYFGVRSEDDLWLALLAQCASPFVTSLLASVFVFLYIKPDFRIVKPTEVVRMLKTSFRMFLSTSSAAVYSSMNPFFVGALLTPESVAAFALAERIIKAFLGLLSPALLALYPYSIRQAQRDRFWSRRLTFLAILCAGGVVVFLNFIAEPLVAYFGGEDFGDVLLIVRILSVSMFFVVVGNVAGIHWLGARGYDRSVLLVTGAAAVMYVIFFPVQILIDGAVGGAWVLLFIEIFVGGGLLLMALLIYKKRIKAR